ncbi:hypothetical protein K2P47_01120 [Patescibacteria group bacterium]|nr:hypothetical protein [Patescibacteria group bacterium]
MKRFVRLLLKDWQISPALVIFYAFSLGLYEMNAYGVYLATTFFYDHFVMLFLGFVVAKNCLDGLCKKVMRFPV